MNIVFASPHCLQIKSKPGQLISEEQASPWFDVLLQSHLQNAKKDTLSCSV